MAKPLVRVDIDELLAGAGPIRVGARCKVCVALAKLDDKDAAKMSAAIENRDSYTAQGLARVFEALGHQVSRPSVERHRNKQCLGNA